jgi:hypothetical protein
MSLRVVCLVGLLAGVVGSAHAITCYEIVDSGDATLYRAAVPPFPLDGSEWNAAQARLRKEGRHLLWFDTSNCPEDVSSPAYSSVKAENASDLLQARSARSAGGIYTRESSSPPSAAAAGGRPVVVVPAAGAGVGYSR